MPLKQFTLTEAVRDMPGVQAATDNEGMTILTRRGKAPLIVVSADLTTRMLRVVDQANRFLSDPAIAHLAQLTGLFSETVSALDHSTLKKPDWLSAALAELQALAKGE